MDYNQMKFISIYKMFEFDEFTSQCVHGLVLPDRCQVHQVDGAVLAGVIYLAQRAGPTLSIPTHLVTIKSVRRVGLPVDVCSVRMVGQFVVQDSQITDVDSLEGSSLASVVDVVAALDEDTVGACGGSLPWSMHWPALTPCSGRLRPRWHGRVRRVLPEARPGCTSIPAVRCCCKSPSRCRR